MGAELGAGCFVYEIEPRFSADVDVTILLDMPWVGVRHLATRMLNFSRQGFCVATSQPIPAGTALSLELRGWPAILAHVAWSRGGRTGCQLAAPLSDRRFEAMLLSVEAIDRAGEWNL